jgi:hypothetical protein
MGAMKATIQVAGQPVDAPILGTIRDCRPVGLGWHGILPNGGVLEVKSTPSGGRAEIPEHHLWCRSADGLIVGAWLIERSRRKRARRK